MSDRLRKRPPGGRTADSDLDARIASPGKRPLHKGPPAAGIIQRKPDGAAAPSSRPPGISAAHLAGLTDVAMRPDLAHDAASFTAPTGGSAMPAPVQAKMESAFGVDLSEVRIHERPDVARMGADAYATGRDIHFAPGKYDPTSHSGQELLGHELTHVVQQAQGRVAAPGQAAGWSINESPALEREADDMGRRAADGQRAVLPGTGGIELSGSATRPMQLAAGETIKNLAIALGVGIAAAAAVYWLLPASVVTLITTSGTAALATGLAAVVGEYYTGMIQGIIGKYGGDSLPETGGLGLGFTDLIDKEDAFGNKSAEKGNLAEFRTKLGLTSLAPPLKNDQLLALSGLQKFQAVQDIKKVDADDETAIKQFGGNNKQFVEELGKIRDKAISNLQLADFLGVYLVVIETLLGSDGSKPEKRDLPDNVDKGKPSSLSQAIVDAMYREKVIRSNLAGFSDMQIAWARKTSPVLTAEQAVEANKQTKEGDLRNDDCNLWNVMHKTKYKWDNAVTLISVWELATLLHTPELKKKTKFYNYTKSKPNMTPVDEKQWIFNNK